MAESLYTSFLKSKLWEKNFLITKSWGNYVASKVLNFITKVISFTVKKKIETLNKMKKVSAWNQQH